MNGHKVGGNSESRDVTMLGKFMKHRCLILPEKKRLLCAIVIFLKVDLQLPMFDFLPLEAIITVKESAISKHPLIKILTTHPSRLGIKKARDLG